jgi:hypothetical protein
MSAIGMSKGFAPPAGVVDEDGQAAERLNGVDHRGD